MSICCFQQSMHILYSSNRIHFFFFLFIHFPFLSFLFGIYPFLCSFTEMAWMAKLWNSRSFPSFSIWTPRPPQKREERIFASMPGILLKTKLWNTSDIVFWKYSRVFSGIPCQLFRVFFYFFKYFNSYKLEKKNKMQFEKLPYWFNWRRRRKKNEYSR